MRRSIAVVMTAVLMRLVAGKARAATVDISIVGVSQGFDPAAATGAIGDTFHRTNNDIITHTSTQNGPLSLWNSGNIAAGSTFAKKIDFAGARFAVTVADRKAPSGFVYDVQRKKGDGARSAWKTGITSASVAFKAASSWTWSFRSRLRKTSSGAKSGWSPSASVSVM